MIETTDFLQKHTNFVFLIDICQRAKQQHQKTSRIKRNEKSLSASTTAATVAATATAIIILNK